MWDTYYSNGEVPHAAADKGSFWWKDLLMLCDLFRGVATCTVGDGQSVLSWEDTWNNRLLKELLPRLYSFARNRNISVAKFLKIDDILEHFHIPLSTKAFQELQATIQGIQVQSSEADCCSMCGIPTGIPQNNSTTFS
jgi:hypothetical protein